jgi:hypothetical protein
MVFGLFDKGIGQVIRTCAVLKVCQHYHAFHTFITAIASSQPIYVQSSVQRLFPQYEKSLYAQSAMSL